MHNYLCFVCRSNQVINLGDALKFKCATCGTEHVISHPDPITMALQVLRNTSKVEKDYLPKIPAIKAYRRVTGAGLREAKDVIDKLVEAIRMDGALT